MEWLSDVLRYIFLFLDSIVYSLIGKAYELFMDIAATNIFADGTITKFANRVYALLAIFMLFRLSFSILTYIVNPESASDKSAGGGKLIGNVLITIILLISVPWGFKQVIKLQNELLKDNIVGKIILGVGFDSSSNTSSTTTNTSSIKNQLAPGDEMAWTVFTAFFYPDKEECEDSIKSLEVSDECKTTLGNYGDAYQRITKSRLVNAVIGSGLETARDTTTNEYIFEYTPLISTLVGGFVAYILILFCIQIAVRSVKLGVLELIAPIPVISYLDPKQGKDGMFKKWLKVCGKTFADLFIRLAAIYFAIFLISEITSGGGMENSLTGQKANFLVRVLIILGALMFAKDLPKFIEEITGIKLDGGFSLNPFKNNALLGGLVGGAVGAGLGAVGGFAGNLLAGNKMRDAVRGGFKGFASGGIGGIKDKGLKKDTFTRGAQAGVRSGTNYANWRAAGSTMGGRMTDRMKSAVGARTKAQELDDQIKAYDDIAGLHKSAEDYVVGELAKSKNGKWAKSSQDITFTGSDGANHTIKAGTNLNNLKNALEDKNLSPYQRTLLTEEITALQDYLVDNYMENAGDGAVVSFISQADAIAKQNDIDVKSVSASTFRDAKKTSKQGSSRIKGSSEYQSAKANANANKEAKANK